MKEREAAKEVCRILQEAGHRAVFAGGSVRDILIGNEPEDIDIATSARPEAVEKLFEKSAPTGIPFGVVTVKVNGFDFEIATFREDSEESDGRRPQSVSYSSLEKDARRRDFTINGLYYDPLSEELFDSVGGRKDIEERIIRFIGDAEKRVREDKLRILRAVRFAAGFDFRFFSSTEKALLDHAGEIKTCISSERIKMELDKMLLLQKPSRAFSIMKNLGILKEILPEVNDLFGAEQSRRYHAEGDVWVHTMLVLDKTRERTEDLAVLWAALLHDIGKPSTAVLNKRGDISNYGHETVGEKMGVKLLRRFGTSRKDVEKAGFIIREHMRVKRAGEMKSEKVHKLVVSKHIQGLIDVAWADAAGSVAADPGLQKEKFAWMKVFDELGEHLGAGTVQPLINGHRLKEMGFKPGPDFKRIMKGLIEAQLEGLVTSEEEAVDFVLERYKKKNSF